MNQPSIFKANLWENYKRNIFNVIREALIILQQKENLPVLEQHLIKNSLNRELLFCFQQASYKLELNHHRPTPEGQNPPYQGDKEPAEREKKKPDFYWQLIDHQADEENCERRFVLECKRLGKPSSSSWVLNKNYVNEGIRRFISSPHEYSKGDDSCGMIGYVQNMELQEILDEVNVEAAACSETISPLILSSGWQEGGISEMGHDLERSFPISPIRMYHFWVDVRESS